MKPSAAQIEIHFQDWWDQVGVGLWSDEPGLWNDETLEQLARSVAHEAFLAGAAYVITHAGLNQTIKAAEGGTGDHDE